MKSLDSGKWLGVEGDMRFEQCQDESFTASQSMDLFQNAHPDDQIHFCLLDRIEWLGWLPRL